MTTEEKTPFVENTDSRGIVDMKFPGFEVSFPCTNRSIMIIAIAFFVMLSVTCYIIFTQASVENVRSFGEIFGAKPEKVQVQTDDGIEIIEAYPLQTSDPCYCPQVAPSLKIAPLE